MAARRTRNPKVAGSNPTSTTRWSKALRDSGHVRHGVFRRIWALCGRWPRKSGKNRHTIKPACERVFCFGESLRRPSPRPSGSSEFFLDFLVLLSRPLGNANFVVPCCFGCLPCRLGREHDIFSDVAFLVRYGHRRNMHAFQHVLEQFVSMSDRSQRPQSHRQALFYCRECCWRVRR